MRIILLSSLGIGHVQPELDTLLLHNYLQSFISIPIAIDAICLYSEGVKLACNDSAVIKKLEILEQQGAKIFVCGTCINYFELQNKIMIGAITTMPAIINMQLEATTIFKM
jgi:intracellular sulfur oxidation DsrE/DsrF family protein